MATYPVVARLVGEDYFRSLASRYLRDFPSTSGNIQDLGANMAAFIDTLIELRELAYLSDVARLEWLIQESCRSSDAAPNDLTALADLTPAHFGELHFSLQPSARLLCSSYPLLRIWQSNQQPTESLETISLDEGGDLLLVIRRGTEIEIESLSPGQFALLCQLEQGHSLECAVERALVAEPQLDLAKVLSRCLVCQTLVVERRRDCNFVTHFDYDVTCPIQLGFSA
jgi:hypothetical protein